MLLRFLRFAIVGGTTGAIYAVVVYLCLNVLAISAAWSGAIGYLVSVPVNYLGHRFFAFGASYSSPLGRVVRYGVSTALGIAISAAIMHFSVTAWGIGVAGGVVLTILTIPVVTFLLLDNWVFRTNQAPPATARAKR